MTKNNPKTIFAWCVYDWANSVYTLVIVSAIFPVYYGSITKTVDGNDLVEFIGFQIKNSVLFSYSISFSFLLIAFFTPILTGIADYYSNKKAFMQFFVYLGSLSSALLFFFTSATITQSVILFSLSLIGYSGSIVFYNAYLPEITTEDQYDRISARGYAYGYVGSVLLMLLCLGIILPHQFYGIEEGFAVRLSFLLTGIWWWGFSQYTFLYLPKSTNTHRTKTNWLVSGFKELQKVWKELKHQRLLKNYLLAFFFFNTGVQTVMYVAAIFGESELKIPGDFLIMTVLLIQILAIFGSNFSAYVSSRLGNIKTLQIIILVWVFVCIGAFFINQTGFYVLAGIIGFVMGAVQSLSRATYAKLMPSETGNRASYFGFYDITDKIAIVLGTFSYGLIEQITGSVRNSVLILGVYFVVGLFFLVLIPSKKNYQS